METQQTSRQPGMDLVTKDFGDKGEIKQYRASYDRSSGWGDSPGEAFRVLADQLGASD